MDQEVAVCSHCGKETTLYTEYPLPRMLWEKEGRFGRICDPCDRLQEYNRALGRNLD